jgi:hypothetical protein
MGAAISPPARRPRSQPKQGAAVGPRAAVTVVVVVVVVEEEEVVIVIVIYILC